MAVTPAEPCKTKNVSTTPSSNAATGQSRVASNLLAQVRRDAKRTGPQGLGQAPASEHTSITDAVLIKLQRLYPPVEAPREQGGDAGHMELVNSIQETAAAGEGIGGTGIWEPLLLSHDPVQPDRLLIIAGRRRWRAALEAGVPQVPCIVRDMSADLAYEVAVVENLQCEDMTDIQTAEAYKWLMDNRNYGVREMARRLGKATRKSAANWRFLAM